MTLRARRKSSSASAALKRLREAAGLSVRQIASAIDVPFATYYHYERRYEKDYLPPELVARLTPVLERFGVDPALIRALGLPTELLSDRANKQSEIAELTRPRMSPMERALVSKQLADWKNEVDFDQRSQLLRRFNLAARGIATTLALKYQCTAQLDDLVFAAELGVTSALDRYDHSSDRAFDDLVEECVTKSVRDHIQGLRRLPSWRDPFEWEHALFKRIMNDEVGAPADYGERAIPIYKVILERVFFGRRGSRGLVEGWCRRPLGLLGLNHVYGLPGRMVPWTLNSDIVLLAPHSKGTPLDCNVMIAAGPDAERLGLELVFGTDPSSDDDMIEITTGVLRPHRKRIAFRRSDVVVHRILRTTDLL